MKTCLLLLVMNMFNQFIPIQTNAVSNSDIIKMYLKAKEKIMQQDATVEDVEKVMHFYSDTLYYEHVLSAEKKFLFHGKDDLRSGYISHLGETGNAKITVLNLIEKQNIVIVEYSSKRKLSQTTKQKKVRLFRCTNLIITVKSNTW
jgi:hypothetical protein